jgi:two-component system, chemotaxis family, sensor kinase Cph1
VVRSESVIPGLISYRGQHFPASDIPLPARRVFSLSWMRHQPDIGYVHVPIIPDLNLLTVRALDMSLSVLRSVSAMYTGYLKNMGTHFTMVLMLMKGGQPWGLGSCLQHSAPKFVPYEVRALRTAREHGLVAHLRKRRIGILRLQTFFAQHPEPAHRVDVGRCRRHGNPGLDADH